MGLRVLAVVLVLAGVAHADPNADVTQAFGAFIDGVATGKGSLTGVDVFVSPLSDETDDDGVAARVPSDLADVKALIASSKLKVTKVVVSKGGKSAWIAGEVSGKVERKGKKKTEPIRVSAFLGKDDKGWHVQATHWSVGEKDTKTEMCGSLEPWRVAANVPKDADATVKAVYAALEGDWLMEGGVKTSKFGKLLSDDKNAVAIGSAPKEVFTGGAKIKSVFKKWQISANLDEGKPQARAGIGPDGEMMWIAMSVTAPPDLCTAYRTLFVLAKESSGWRIVHHHYSQRLNPY
ncbi:MAG TPA: nuclear transport factor 2 family protein [Kofleriaceae bacterium]|nr:nuclear transport factor 2 family protein [Kofleriaceae bacterium]